ncbi:carbohydrate-binding protein [Planctomicrobium sp. SH664]|uniref:carbohydrate-binding protein n=1 Tax=Planctomicrobium sp. SH664 TaxID=3448125 RepID=UPI003F5C7BF0
MFGHSRPESDLFDEIGALTDAVIAGVASEEQQARLDRLVCESDDARWAYVQYVYDSVSIHRQLREGRLIRELQGAVTQEESPLPADSEPGVERPHPTEDVFTWISRLTDDVVPYVLCGHLAAPQVSREKRSWKRSLRLLPGICVCSLLLLIGGTCGWWASRSTLVEKPATNETPARFAKIIRSTDCTWKVNGVVATLGEGDWLSVGRYTLSSGLAKVVFPWGTEATIEAPTEIEFTQNGGRQLWHGQLVAKVSPEDTGFMIDTPTVKLIDLGTEFGLSTDFNGESEVHVFKGAVEVRPHFTDRGSPGNPITLTTGEANGFTATNLAVRQIAFNPKRFSRAWRLNSLVAETSGAMRFVHPAPASIVEGRTEANDSLTLFLEREDQELVSPLAVTMTEPGLYTTFNNRSAWLPAGLHVDSYLVHFDPVGSRSRQSPVVVEGSVSFDRPILAVIARGDQLAGSDEWLACRETQYQGFPIFRKTAKESFSSNFSPSYAIRGLSGQWNLPYLHESPAPNDWVRLSADRKTLTVRCTARGEADQLRIVVSSDGENHPAVVPATQDLIPRPFRGRPFHVDQIIEAEDFDLGGQDVAYYDTTPDSLANVYRTNESVELKQYLFGEQTITNVSVARAGEWLTYTVDIEQPGQYVIQAHAGSQLRGGKFRFEIGVENADNPAITPSVAIPITTLEHGPVENWYATVTSAPVELQAGRQLLRVVMEANHSSGRLGNFDWFRIVPLSPSATNESIPPAIP